MGDCDNRPVWGRSNPERYARKLKQDYDKAFQQVASVWKEVVDSDFLDGSPAKLAFFIEHFLEAETQRVSRYFPRLVHSDNFDLTDFLMRAGLSNGSHTAQDLQDALAWLDADRKDFLDFTPPAGHA